MTVLSRQNMESALRYIHDDSDSGTSGGFRPDEERRAKVQVGDQKLFTSCGCC